MRKCISKRRLGPQSTRFYFSRVSVSWLLFRSLYACHMIFLKTSQWYYWLSLKQHIYSLNCSKTSSKFSCAVDIFQAGTINLNVNNPQGCQPCFCFGLGLKCSEKQWATGQVCHLVLFCVHRSSVVFARRRQGDCLSNEYTVWFHAHHCNILQLGFASLCACIAFVFWIVCFNYSTPLKNLEGIWRDLDNFCIPCSDLCLAVHLIQQKHLFVFWQWQ